jgi:hypothetical protein
MFPDSLTTFPGLHLAIRFFHLGLFRKYIIHVIFTISATNPLQEKVLDIDSFLVYLMPHFQLPTLCSNKYYDVFILGCILL